MSPLVEARVWVMARLGGLEIAAELAAFVEQEALPGTGLEAAAFWAAFEETLAEMAPRNAALLAERDRLQAAIDDWHRRHPARPIDAAAYQASSARSATSSPRARTSPSRQRMWTPRSRVSPARSWSCRSPTRATR